MQVMGGEKLKAKANIEFNRGLQRQTENRIILTLNQRWPRNRAVFYPLSV